MNLETSRFGTMEVDPGSIITFTQPIIGFQEYRRYIIVPGPNGGEVKWLQSTDSGDLAFILMNPTHVIPDYSVQLRAEEMRELAVTRVEELDVYTLVVVPKDPSKVRTNLRAPILISPKHRLGKQAILENSDYPIQFFLAQAQDGQGRPEEVTNAGADA
jgi:flagellar assembly factor FliW